MTRCRPSPHARLQNKTKTQCERPTRAAAACAPLPPRRPARLGPPARGSGELAEPRAPSAGGGRQTGPAGSFGSGPAKGAQRPPSGTRAGAGGGTESGRLRAFLGSEPGGAVPRSGDGVGRRLPEGLGGGEAAPPPGRIPRRGPGRAASSAWQSSCSNSLFRNSSGAAGGRGEPDREERAGATGTRRSRPGGGSPPPPRPNGKSVWRARMAGSLGPFFRVCHSLSCTH